MKRNPLNLLRFTLTCLLFVLGGAALTAYAKEKAAEPPNKSFDRKTELTQRAEIHQWLMSELVAAGRANPVSVPVSEGERLEIDLARGEVPERVGLARSLTRGVSFADVDLKSLKGAVLARETGALRGADDGGYVFTAALGSPGATGVRVHFTGFRLPENAGVYLFTEDGQVFGPYTGRGPLGDGEFWSHTLIGDEIMQQLRHVGPVSNAELAGTSFKIAGLAHLRPRFLGGACSYNAECVRNLACETNVDAAVDVAKNAVAHMQWISGAFVYFCSGGLLADEVSSSQIPYFLTANHCISRAKDAQSLETFFKLNDETGSVDVNCTTGTCDDWRAHRADHPQSLRTLGSVIRATGRASDYTLLELSQPAPAGTAFLGWSTAPVAFTNNPDEALLFRISHPSGAPQSYSEHVVDTTAGTCSSWPRGNWIYSRDLYGATEGGSSGSPVVNSAGVVVGQLSGACGTNVSDNCDRENNATVDGAFAAYFDEVAPFLDPGTSCVPVAEVCGDVIDNDCDGRVDEGCVPPGEPCDSNSDCASGKWSGKPGVKICR